MNPEQFNENLIKRLTAEPRTVSRARHFALIMLVLIGVAAYAGWHYQNQKAPTLAMTTNAMNVTLGNQAESFIPADALKLVPEPILPTLPPPPVNNATNTSYARLLGDAPTLENLSSNSNAHATAIELPDAVNDILPPLEALTTTPNNAHIAQPQNNSVALARTHKITENDSLPDLAKQYYGSDSPENIRLIRHANPFLASGGFKVGAILTLPSANNAAPVSPIVAPVPQHLVAAIDREYVVQAGDTLARIAGKLYGRPGAWQDIYHANRDRLSAPEKLVVGMKLRLPFTPTE